MKMRYYIILGVMLLASSAVFAQDLITVTGYVNEKKGREPLIGVTIQTTNPKVTVGSSDRKGAFRVKVRPNAVLTFSYLGFDPVTVPVNSRSSLNVEMEESSNMMDEVVVQGYAERSRETLTGSSITISGKDIQDVPVANVAELLQGKVAGMNVQMNTGMPGAAASIQIRGISSIAITGSGGNAFLTSTSPLFVVDGVQVDLNSGYEYGFSGGGPAMSPLSLIPPEDIESLDVLKDAAATALYGSKGAYGVIVVTTKRGHSQVPIIQFSHQSFFSTPPSLKSVIGGQLERQLRIAQIYANDTTIFTGRDKIYDNYMLADSLNPYFNNSTNWQDLFYGTTYNQTYTLSTAGGDMKFNYKVNGGYYKENGIIRNTGFTRYSLSMNSEYLPTERFRMFVTMAGTIGDQQKGSGNGVEQTGVSRSSSASSLLPPPTSSTLNPDLLSSLSSRNENRNTDLKMSVDLRYEFVKGLSLSNFFSYNYTAGREDNFTTAVSNNNRSKVYNFDSRRISLNNRTNLSYINEFGQSLINTYAFTEITSNSFQSRAQELSNTPNDQYEGPLGYDGSSAKGGVLDNYAEGRLAGFGAAFSYQFAKKYILDLTYRFDGTSVNGPDIPYTHNPSIAARWNMEKENFMSGTRTWLDFLSLRASWGRNIVPTGSIFDSYGKYVFSGSFNNYQTIGLDWGRMPNTSLVPTVSTQLSGAVEAGFFGNRITTIQEYYYKQVDDQLWEKPLADHNAFANIQTNEVSLVNYGYEVTFNFRAFAPKDPNRFSWTIGLNGGFNKDVLTSLPDRGRELMWYDDVNKQNILYRLGQNTLTNVLYDFRGVFATDADVPVNPGTGEPYKIVNGGKTYYFKAGDPYWTDVNGDYILDDRDLVAAGNSQPRVTGGINSFMQYHGFSLNVNMSFTFKRDVLNNALAQQLASYSDPLMQGQNAYNGQAISDLVPLDKYNFWLAPGQQNASYPNPFDYLNQAVVQPFRYDQTLFMEDASYLKINNVTLSYNVPRTFSQRYSISSFRVYLTANNIYTFSNYSGPDPENVTALGRDNSNGYPTRRSFTLGVNMQF